jgi:hypothetical protein
VPSSRLCPTRALADSEATDEKIVVDAALPSLFAVAVIVDRPAERAMMTPVLGFTPMTSGLDVVQTTSAPVTGAPDASVLPSSTKICVW